MTTTELTLDNSVMAPYVFTVSPGYLEAAGTWRLGGRDVSWQDTTSTAPVAIVNQTFASKMWGDTPAIGRHFLVRRDELIEVVGVVEDGKYHSIQESPQPVVYFSWSQNGPNSVTLVVRSPRTVKEMVAPLERTLKGLVPIAELNVRHWHDSLGGMLFPARAATVSLGVMGLFAALLTVTGIFGIAACNVSHRMKELGIRVALGARPKALMAAALGRPIVLLPNARRFVQPGRSERTYGTRVLVSSQRAPGRSPGSSQSRRSSRRFVLPVPGAGTLGGSLSLDSGGTFQRRADAPVRVPSVRSTSG